MDLRWGELGYTNFTVIESLVCPDLERVAVDQPDAGLIVDKYVALVDISNHVSEFVNYKNAAARFFAVRTRNRQSAWGKCSFLWVGP